MSTKSRALHYVLKIGNLKKNLKFFRDKLGMTVLRHEVFEQGCEAACNGPYNGKWSKTMIGYGPEDTNFVLELTYNYSIGKYNLGNDLQYIKIALLEEKFNKILKETDKKEEEDDKFILYSPDGYKFIMTKLVEPKEGEKQDIREVCLSCKSIRRTKNYWSDLLKMTEVNIDDEEKDKSLLLNYDVKNNQAYLRFKQIEEDIDHKAAYGRIAFSCPSNELKSIQKRIEDVKDKVLTPYLSLDTPGKATVQVVILADPNGHEICFVGDEGFRELSQVDEKANELIEESIAADKSDEWFHKKKIMKTEV